MRNLFVLILFGCGQKPLPPVQAPSTCKQIQTNETAIGWTRWECEVGTQLCTYDINGDTEAGILLECTKKGK